MNVKNKLIYPSKQIKLDRVKQGLLASRLTLNIQKIIIKEIMNKKYILL